MRRPFAFFLVFVLVAFLQVLPLEAQSLQNPRFLPTSIAPVTMFIGDLNNDGLPDLAYAGNYFVGDAETIHTLLNDGKGNYAAGPDITLPSGIVSSCLVLDVNGDKKNDLVCSGDGTHAEIAVLLGNGDGSFASANIQNIPPLQRVYGDGNIVSAAGDLNNDGHPDLIITNEIGGALVPMLGDGAGHFTATTPLMQSATHIILTDLNGDGKLDMVAQGVLTRNTGVYLGQGDSTFNFLGQTWRSNSEVVLGDLDGDGLPDLIGGGFGVLQIFRGHSDGSFDTNPTQVFNFNNDPNNFNAFGHSVYLIPLACADLDGDGHPDLLALGTNGLVFFPGKGALQLASPRSYPAEEDIPFGNFGQQRLIDMNGDGHPDYVAVGPDGLYISYGRGDGTFQAGREYSAGRTVAGLTLADFNEDGAPDVVSTGDLQMYLSLGKPDGSFADAVALPPVTPAVNNPSTQGWTNVAHGDINGDGHQDLVAVHAVQNGLPELTVLLGHGDGSFDAPVPVQGITGDTMPIVLDVNGDGSADIILNQGNLVTILLSQKGGSFSTATITRTAPPSDYASTAPALGDLNGDGIPDLAYVTTSHLAVAAGKGDGTFGAPVFYNLPVASGTISVSQGTLALGDFDGDGASDIAVVVLTDGPGPNDRLAQTFVFYSQSKTGAFDQNTFTAAVPGPTSTQLTPGISAADLDGDGRSDVILSRVAGQAYPQTDLAARGLSNRSLGPLVDLVDGFGVAPLSFADLNGDGRADLLKPMTYGNSFAVLLTQQPIQPTGTLTATPSPVLYAGAFTIAASVAATGQSGPFTGTLTFAVDGKTIGTAALANGAASIAGPSTLAIGTHNIAVTSTILKDAQGSYSPIAFSGTEAVTALPVVVSLSSSANPVITGQSTTFTVQVANAPADPTTAQLPGGQVTVQVDGVTLGTGNGDGKSAFSLTLPYTGSTVGSHTVIVTYPGDATHLPGTATLQQTVSAIPGSFTLSASPASVSVSTAASGSTQLTVVSVGGFFGPVKLSYSDLPPGVTATFNPGSLTLTSGGQATAALTFTSTGLAASNPSTRAPVGIALASFSVLMLPLAGTRRGKLKRLVLLLPLGIVCIGLNGCSHPRPLPPAPKVYTVTVTGTGNAAQVISATTVISLSVAQ